MAVGISFFSLSHSFIHKELRLMDDLTQGAEKLDNMSSLLEMFPLHTNTKN